MKFTADASAMKKAIDMLRPGDSSRFSLPHQSGVMIECRGKGVIELTTTSLDRWESIKVMGQQVHEPGFVVVSYAKFKRLMGAMKDETIDAEVIEGEEVKQHIYSPDGPEYLKTRLQVTSGKTRLALVPSTAEKMPAHPTLNSPTTVPLHLGAAREVYRFTSADYGRPILNCAFYDEGTYVATDSYRLATVEVPENATDRRFLIHRDAIDAMVRLGPEKFVDLQVDDTNFSADFGDARVTARITDGEFPRYQTLIPESKRSAAKVTEELRDAALKMHRLLTAIGYDHKYGGGTPVKIEQIDHDSVLLSSRSGNNVIEIKALGNVDTTVGFNPWYLADFFAGTDVDSMFGMDSIKPWGLEEAAPYCAGAKRTRLLMPVRMPDNDGAWR